MEKLVVVCPRDGPSPRLDAVLARALDGVGTETVGTAEELSGLAGRRLLFAVAAGADGVNLGYCAMLRRMRAEPELLAGCCAGMIVDCASELYTKSLASELALAANTAGCLFVGRPLVEGTGSLKNFDIQARLAGTGLEDAYFSAARDLVDRVTAYSSAAAARPCVLALHASRRETSNTLDIWDIIREKLAPACSVSEIGLRNGTVVDCSGCPYTMCLHYGEKGECFYGGVMVSDVYPALRAADALFMLCPNYNDAMPANMSACVNRLTAMFRTAPFFGKKLFAVVVSGYSGGDIVARQLISALCMNKSFCLPPRFVLMETANDAGAALALPGIRRRAEEFADAALRSMRGGFPVSSSGRRDRS